MITTEPECHGTPESAGLRVERLPFERIPHQSRLFLDYCLWVVGQLVLLVVVIGALVLLVQRPDHDERRAGAMRHVLI